MRGNGDFEAKCPAIWEFDFMKRLEAQRFFCWGKCSQLVMAGRSRSKNGVLLERLCPGHDAGERRDLILIASPTAHMPARRVRYKE